MQLGDFPNLFQHKLQSYSLGLDQGCTEKEEGLNPRIHSFTHSNHAHFFMPTKMQRGLFKDAKLWEITIMDLLPSLVYYKHCLMFQ